MLDHVASTGNPMPWVHGSISLLLVNWHCYSYDKPIHDQDTQTTWQWHDRTQGPRRVGPARAGRKPCAWVASVQSPLISYRHSAPRPTSKHQGSPALCKEWLLFMSLKTWALTVKSGGGQKCWQSCPWGQQGRGHCCQEERGTEWGSGGRGAQSARRSQPPARRPALTPTSLQTPGREGSRFPARTRGSPVSLPVTSGTLPETSSTQPPPGSLSGASLPTLPTLTITSSSEKPAG